MFPRKNTVAPASSIGSSLNVKSIRSESSLSDDDNDQQPTARSTTQLTNTKKTPVKQPIAPIQHRLVSKAKSSRKPPPSAASNDSDRPDTPPRIQQEEKVLAL